MRIKGKPTLRIAAPSASVLRAAIYARKSTDDSSRSEENRSTTRQVTNAKKFIAEKGWTLDEEEHVYVDEAVSGGEFENRPGFSRLIADLPKRGPRPFDVLVMSEPSRLGRDQSRTVYYLAHIRDCGVQVWYYLDQRQELLDTPEGMLMASVKAYAAEVERMAAGTRSRDKLVIKAAAGHNAGGRVYGYDNVWLMPDGMRKLAEPGARKLGDWTTDYKINKAEADTIRRLFKMYADGWGFTALAKTLNCDSHYLAQNRKYFAGKRPAAPRNGTGSWAGTSIREMLHNRRYCGLVPYGEYKKVYRHGTKQRLKVGPPQYAERPDLEIIDKNLWSKVQKQLDSARREFGKTNSAANPQRVSRYFLSGLAKCGTCGASMIATAVALGSGRKRKLVPHYMCSAANKRGDTVCTHATRRRVDEIDEKVRLAIENSLLSSKSIDLESHLKLVEAQRKKEPDKAKHLESQIRRVTRELDNLVKLTAAGEALDRVLPEMRNRQETLAKLNAELAQVPPREFNLKDVRALKATLAERREDFRRRLRADVPTAREALNQLLGDKPIRLVPIKLEGRKDFGVRGETVLGALLSSGLRIRLEIADQGPKTRYRNLGRPHGDSNPGYRRERAMS